MRIIVSIQQLLLAKMIDAACRNAPATEHRCNVYVFEGFFRPKLANMDDQYCKRVAKNVRAYRKNRALSLESLAERADMHWTFISGVERCKYNLSLSSLVRIAKALGWEPYELLK